MEKIDKMSIILNCNLGYWQTKTLGDLESHIAISLIIRWSNLALKKRMCHVMQYKLII